MRVYDTQDSQSTSTSNVYIHQQLLHEYHYSFEVPSIYLIWNTAGVKDQNVTIVEICVEYIKLQLNAYLTD